jgi:hypothetical protein
LPSELPSAGAAGVGGLTRAYTVRITQDEGPMSTDPHVTATPPTAPPPAAPAPGTSALTEIKIISHSNIFYWWPVWAVGLLMALLTFVEGRRMILVPGPMMGNIEEWVEVDRRLQVVSGPDDPNTGRPPTATREGITLKKGHLLPDKFENPAAPPRAELPKLRTTASSSYGVVWATILLIVIVITNVPLRGLWSVVIIVTILLISVIFGLLDWWSTILDTLSVLDIRINMGGYLFISLILLGIWLVSMIFFDRQVYMVFSPGQVKVCLEVGGGETSYDTMGLVIQKQRDDLFRHWILGLGSGDLIVRTSGANAHEFHLPNVLFVGRKLQLIEEMQRERPVVKG